MLFCQRSGFNFPDCGSISDRETRFQKAAPQAVLVVHFPVW